MESKKKQRTNPMDGSDLLDRLPDDLVISILCKLSSTASSPSDFFSLLITCKRLNRLGLNPLVLNQAGSNMLAVLVKNWSEPAHRFLRKCVGLGNIEACYILGMIRYYCLKNRTGGISLIAKAGIKSHIHALYSLAVIYFNGSGATKSHRDLCAGIAFFTWAASLGHVDALRELGHCLQDGYGIPRSVAAGRRFLMRANLRDLLSSLHSFPALSSNKILSKTQNRKNDNVLLLRKLYGRHVAIQEPHPVNKFLIEWFGSKDLEPGLKMCSNPVCGRPQTRANEYRRCSVCGKAIYCSRGCQAQDWKMRHKVECATLDQGDFDDLHVGTLDGGDEAGDVGGIDRVAEDGDLVGGANG